MILCDMDGVLATGPGMDTHRGEPIYRTFRDVPEELERIEACGIPFHVVTAKVTSEALQVLKAVGVHGHVASVIGADKLFWPSVWAAIRQRRLPNALSKRAWGRTLSPRNGGRIVMIEDRREHLEDMLTAETIDVGILVPPIVAGEGRILEWFDLNLVLRLARQLSTGTAEPSAWPQPMVATYRWEDGAPRRLEAPHPRETLKDGRYLFHFPGLSFTDDPSTAPTLESLNTGQVLRAVPPNMVNTVRAGRRMIRRIVSRLSSARAEG